MEVLSSFDRNRLFLDEMAHFLRCIEGTEAPLVPLEEGARTLQMAFARLASMERKQAVEVAR